jgi:hypothetical protein
MIAAANGRAMTDQSFMIGFFLCAKSVLDAGEGAPWQFQPSTLGTRRDCSVDAHQGVTESSRHNRARRSRLADIAFSRCRLLLIDQLVARMSLKRVYARLRRTTAKCEAMLPCGKNPRISLRSSELRRFAPRRAATLLTTRRIYATICMNLGAETRRGNEEHCPPTPRLWRACLLARRSFSEGGCAV